MERSNYPKGEIGMKYEEIDKILLNIEHNKYQWFFQAYKTK